MSQVSVSTPFNIYLEFEIAPFIRRLLAWVIDMVVLMVYARGMKYLLEEVIWDKSTRIGIDFLIVSIPMLLYHLLMEVLYQGQSLGKKAMDIRVISLEGGEPRLGQYLMRWIFRIWEWPMVFGYLAVESYWLFIQIFVTGLVGLVVVIIIAVSNKSQRLGDLAAGTTVVDLRNRFSLADTLFKDIQETDYKVRFPDVMRLSDRDINAIRSVIAYSQKNSSRETANRVASKVQSVLSLQSDMEPLEFLETLLNDYNYLATREKLV
ncbi:MAG TPA: RDD family protein [Phnomibacter sp.]|nr:RDD family protein [Phnomibacter sp.]